MPWLIPGAERSEDEIVAAPEPSWKFLELGHMLQSMMQLSKIVTERICSMEVSKPVSIKTKLFGRGSAWAGAKYPRVSTKMSEITSRIPAMVKTTTDKSGHSLERLVVVLFGKI